MKFLLDLAAGQIGRAPDGPIAPGRLDYLANAQLLTAAPAAW
jgi:hypothetical protein